jgi:hypothetical protein
MITLSTYPVNGSLLILSGNETLKEYTFEELKALPSVDIEKTILSGKSSGYHSDSDPERYTFFAPYVFAVI